MVHHDLQSTQVLPAVLQKEKYLGYVDSKNLIERNSVSVDKVLTMSNNVWLSARRYSLYSAESLLG